MFRAFRRRPHPAEAMVAELQERVSRLLREVDSLRAARKRRSEMYHAGREIRDEQITRLENDIAERDEVIAAQREAMTQLQDLNRRIIEQVAGGYVQPQGPAIDLDAENEADKALIEALRDGSAMAQFPDHKESGQ